MPVARRAEQWLHERRAGHLLDFSGLRATFLNCTLTRSPEPSHTQGLVDASAAIMRKHGIEVEVLRVIDHDIATGVYPDLSLIHI